MSEIATHGIYQKEKGKGKKIKKMEKEKDEESSRQKKKKRNGCFINFFSFQFYYGICLSE